MNQREEAREAAERRSGLLLRALVFIAAFAALAAAILARPDKRLNDFDQSFYLTIAYDLTRHGVFSNGIFDDVDSTTAKPSAGMFFGPGYPALVAGVMALSPRFDAAVVCNVQANHGKRDFNSCEIYARPMLLVHAALLAAAVLAIALAGEALFAKRAVFFGAAGIATVGFAFEAELFSFLMTESLTIALYSLAALFALRAWRGGRAIDWLLAGVLVGLLCLTRTSYLVIVPVFALLGLVAAWLRGREFLLRFVKGALLYVAAFAVVLAPWLARNLASIGKLGLTEEYGAATIVERFAYDRMTLVEGLLAFPYCVPVVGPPLVAALAGSDAMARFDWRHKGGFFDSGRSHRVALTKQHGRLDPVIGGIVRDELRERGMNYLLVSIPLAWCGLWVAQFWSLIAIPIFAAALVAAARRRRWDYLLYAAPPFVMVALHAAVANHYSRYNLILIGAASIGVAWLSNALAARLRRRPSRQAA